MERPPRPPDRPPTGAVNVQPVPQRSVNPPRRQYRPPQQQRKPVGRWDFRKVEAFAPRKTPAQAPFFERKPGQDLNQYQAQPRKPSQVYFSAPGRIPQTTAPVPGRYVESATRQPPPKEYGVWEGIKEHAKGRWELAGKRVKEAGKSEPGWLDKGVKQLWEAAPIVLTGGMELPESPVKGATSFLWEGLTTVGSISAESTQKVAGNIYHSLPGMPTAAETAKVIYDFYEGDPKKAITDWKMQIKMPLKQKLGVDDDPLKQQAWSAAMDVSYSGPVAIESAYKDALALAQRGQLTPENREIMASTHGDPFREFAGEVLLDPLNIIDVVAAAGKVPKMFKWTSGATDMFSKPWKVGNELASTADVVSDLKGLTSVKGQVAKAEDTLHKVFAKVNPRLKHGIVDRVATGAAQIVEIVAGVTQRSATAEVSREMAKAGAGMADELVKTRAMDKFQDIASLWAKMGSDNLDEVKQAADALTQLGFDTVPKSQMGRYTGVVLSELIGTGDEQGDLIKTLKVARESGQFAEDVAEAFYKKAANVLDDLMPTAKFEQGIVQRGAKAILSKRKPLDTFFSGLFMGLSPGYAARNFYDNTARILLNGYSPVRPLTHISDQIGFNVVGAAKGIGQAEELTSLPFHRLAGWFESKGSEAITEQAYGDALRQLWPKAMAQVPEQYRPLIRDVVYYDMGQLENLARVEQVENWRMVSDNLVEIINHSDPNLYQNVADILYRSDSPESAIAAIKELQLSYADQVKTLTNELKPHGAMSGSTAGQAVEQVIDLDKLDELDDLGERLGEIEHKILSLRNNVYADIARSYDTDLWLRLSQRVEENFSEALKELNRRQLLGYIKVKTGKLKPEQYAEHLTKLYDDVYQQMSEGYAQKLRGMVDLGGERQVLESILQEEALAAGYPSATTSRKTGETVPDMRWGNKIRKELRGFGIAKPRLDQIKTAQDLTDDETVLLINKFREMQGEQALDVAAEVSQRVTKAVDIPDLDVRLDELPIADMADLQALMKTTQDPDVNRAITAMFSKFEMAPGSNHLDSVFTTARRAQDTLTEVMQDVIKNARNPQTIPGQIPVEVMEQVRRLYTETHTVSAEIARRARNFSLLDYNDRRYFDTLFKVVYPWHYWWSRSVPNWALSLATRPNIAAHYMKLKKHIADYNRDDPTIPDWAREQIKLTVPGFAGQVYWDYESAFNAVGGIFDTFDNPDAEKDNFGKIIQGLGKVGPAPHPLLMMAYAAERELLYGDTEGARSLGYLSSQTRALAAVTGKPLEPWLWLTDEQGERIPFTGGTKFDIEKGVRKIGYDQSTGELQPEEAVIGAATRSGEAFETTMEGIHQEYRSWPVLLSLLGGMRVTMRGDWENKITDTNNQYWELREAGKIDEAQQLLEENPWLGTTWFSWKNEANRMRMLAENVFHRLPPMAGEDRQQIMDSVGLTEPMLEMYYSDRDPGRLSDWDKRDYEQFVNGVLDLAELVKVPDAKTAKAWREARTTRREFQEKVDQQFPEGREQEKTYFTIKESEGEEAAKEYLQTTNLSDYWDMKNQFYRDNPELIKYYGGPEKVDSLTSSLAYDTLENQYPGLWQNISEYYEIPKDDWRARREFRRQHPEVVSYKDEHKELVKQYREEFKYLREQKREPLQTVDYVIDGQPNVAQRQALEAIEEVEQVKPVPYPEFEPDKLTPQEKEYYQSSDQTYAQMVEKYPQYADLETEYEQIENMLGKESAQLFAKQSGLYQMRDEHAALNTQNPVWLANADEEAIGYTAKALMRQQARSMWPNIDELLDGYYQIESGDKRRAYRSDHPELRAYWDYKRGAEDFYKQQLQQQQQQQQQPAPQKVAGKASLDSQGLAEAIATVESGGDYQAQNPKSSASGKYQYINSTWGNFGNYQRARDAPPEIQDQKMMMDLQVRLEQYDGDIEKAIAAHYYPMWANDKSKWSQRPTKDQMTVREYVDKVMEELN